jgi:hypothetical protein
MSHETTTVTMPLSEFRIMERDAELGRSATRMLDEAMCIARRKGDVRLVKNLLTIRFDLTRGESRSMRS